MNNNLTKNGSAASAYWIAALVFFLPFLSLVTLHGISASSYLLLLSALFWFKDCRAALARHWRETRWVILAFLFKFIFVVACFLLRPAATENHLEKPLRSLLAVSALAVVLVARAPRRALWWGVIGGALVSLPLVMYQRFTLAIDRPGGLLNPITYGDLALLLGLLSLVAAIDFRHTGKAVWPAALGALAGLAASLLTGTRGGLVALLPAAVLFLRFGHVMPGRRLRLLLGASFALVVAACCVPGLGLQERMVQGVDEVRAWEGGGNKVTNVGIRLELWKGAAMLVRDHPLLGVESNQLKQYLGAYIARGELDPVVLTMPHLHNEVLQALATGGMVGLLAWLGVMLAPLAYFARTLRRGGERCAQFTPALAGLLVVTSYLCFGLTEVIFWSMKGCLFYALTVFLLVGFCENAKETIGK
jgi:O-antigen ligase